jgi:hypothetical protein
MAILNDTVISGDLRVSGKMYGNAKTADIPEGFASRNDFSWGSLGGTAYTHITDWSATGGSEIAFAAKDSKLYVQIDGVFYQNEGAHQVLDTSSSLAAGKLTGTIDAARLPDLGGTYLKLTGGTMTGTITPYAGVGLNFSSASGHAITTSYQDSGNRALVVASAQANASIMFVNGEDSITNHGSDRWKSLTPGLQIKNNCVSIGKLIGDGVTPSYALDVNGSTNSTNVVVNSKVRMQYNANAETLDFYFI